MSPNKPWTIYCRSDIASHSYRKSDLLSTLNQPNKSEHVNLPIAHTPNNTHSYIFFYIQAVPLSKASVGQHQGHPQFPEGVDLAIYFALF